MCTWWIKILTKTKWCKIPLPSIPPMECLSYSVPIGVIILVTEVYPRLPVSHSDILVIFCWRIVSIELTVSDARPSISGYELIPEWLLLDHEDKINIFPFFPSVGDGIVFFSVSVYFFFIFSGIEHDSPSGTEDRGWRLIDGDISRWDWCEQYLIWHLLNWRNTRIGYTHILRPTEKHRWWCYPKTRKNKRNKLHSRITERVSIAIQKYLFWWFDDKIFHIPYNDDDEVYEERDTKVDRHIE